MLAVCNADAPVAFKAPKTSSHTKKKDSQGKKPGAKSGYKKQPSLKQPSMSSIKATKVPTPVDHGMHKEDQQATGDPTSLGVTSEDEPTLSSVVDEGTKNYSLYHTFAVTNPNVLPGTTHSVSEGLKTVLTQTDTGKGACTIAKQFEEDEAFKTIKLEDLEKLSQKHKLELEKNKAEAEVTLLIAQPSFHNVGQLNELLVKSLHTEFSKILSAHDFSSSLPTELKELLTKFNKLAKDVKGLKKQVHELKIELPGDLKKIPTKQEDFTKSFTSLTSQVAERKTLRWELPTEFLLLPTQVAYAQAKLKTFDALLSLLQKVTEALNMFAQVFNTASKKAGDTSVPSAGQAGTIPVEGEKNTNQATISQLFQRRADKDAEKNNLNKQQPESTTPLTTPTIPPIITTTTYMQSPFLQSPPKSSSHPEGEQTKEDKGKKVTSLKDDEEEITKSDSDDENTSHVAGSMTESSKKKKLRKFDFVTKGGDHFHLTQEQINEQKKIDEDAKAKAAKQEGEVIREELVDLLGPDVVSKYYNAKLQYDKYCDKMLNKRAKSRITNRDVLTRKGPITPKVYREDGASEIIPDFQASDLHLGERREVVKAYLNKTGKGWKTIYEQIQTRMDYLHQTEEELGIDLDKPLSEQNPLDKLNDLANKKRKHVDDIHDYFKANKRLKSSVQYEDYPAGTVLNKPVLAAQEIFFRLYQGPGIDDHARTFSSFLLAEVDKRNLNPLKQMRFSLVDNSKLNDVYLLNRRLKQNVSLLEGLQGGKRLIYVKKNKTISLGMTTSKVGIEVQQLSLQANLVASSRKRQVDKRGSRAVQVESRAVHDGLLDARVSPDRKVYFFPKTKPGATHGYKRLVDE
ncbi:hypothetical protein Tco_0548496 [Tanacetum coccineum]